MQTRNRLFVWLKKPLILIVLVLSIILILQQIHILPSLKNWFKPKPVLIDNTPLVITKIKTIAQLNTAQLYAEVVVDSTVITRTGIALDVMRNINILPVPELPQKKLVLIAKGRVIAGIDMQLLNPEDVFAKEDSVSLLLPAPAILGVITNPADFETFTEDGTWSNTDVQLVKAGARRKLLQAAADQHLLQQAGNRSKAVLEQFLRTSGFTKVNIQFKK